MAAVTETYPISGGPLVRGDPFTIAVPISVDGTYAIPDGWTFRAHIRRRPDSELVTEFTITEGTAPVAGVDVPALILSLDADQSALLHAGCGFDLERLTPSVETLWIVHSLRIEKDYSWDPEVTST